ncbi:hypothetical protein N2152v2_000010 [Parachlorella kessleri]
MPQLSYVGVGEAGWGCERAAEQYRGCKWTARAGVVLQLPDHERLPAPYEPPTAVDPTPVFLFRNYALLSEQPAAAQSPALKGLGKCDWGEFGFQLSSTPLQAAAVPSANAAAGDSQIAGRSSSTAGQDRKSTETRSEAATGKPLPLAATYEARMVRAALEGALRHLKEQTPAVVASRRDRSQLRCGPYLARSIAGIIQRSLDHEFVQQAQGLLGCSKQLAGAQLEGLLTPEAIASLQPAAETTEYEAQKRQRLMLAVPVTSGATLRRAPCRQQSRSRRARVVVAAAPGDLSPEQLQGALERQLNRSATKGAPGQPAAAAAASSGAGEGSDPASDLERRQQEARKWITPWLEAKARGRSKELQSGLRERVTLLSMDEEQRALKRQLSGGGSFDEGSGVALSDVGQEVPTAPAAAPAAAATKEPAVPAGAGAAGSSSKLGQPHLFEDGSLLFTSEMLQAVSFEDVLTA